jgi:hypothetical protein
MNHDPAEYVRRELAERFYNLVIEVARKGKVV